MDSIRTGSSSPKNVIPAPSRAGDSFSTPYAACNFIVNWDGRDVHELLEAIHCARRLGDRFIQDKLIEYILAIPLRHPRPDDVPAYSGAPVWAVDRSGEALIGMPGRETIVSVDTLRKSASVRGGAFAGPMMRNGTTGMAS